MEYSEKLNTNVRKDVGIESNNTLCATRRVCHFYIYVTFIQVTLNCSVLSVFTYSFCKTGSGKDITITALMPTSNKKTLLIASFPHLVVFQKRKF